MIGPAKERKRPPMKKVPKRKPERHESRANGLQTSLFEWVVATGLEQLGQRLEAERTEVCGPRSRKDPTRRARRMGHAPGELVMGGRKVRVQRPRARTMDGQEVQLPSWEQFSALDPLMAHVVRQMLLGMTTRGYAKGLEPAPQVESRGTSRSAVSRRFVASTEVALRAFLERPLADFDLVVLMIDGIHIDGQVVLVALGVDGAGHKRVLGLHEGATENETATTALLTNLRERGLRADRSVLVVTDGAKALHKAVRNVFGEKAVMQRCQVHKMRNVLDHMPDKRREFVGAALRRAWRAPSVADALRQLESLAKTLESEAPSAAASVREGAAETVAILRFALPPALERTLRTTNAIENLMGSIRRVSRRVKRWRGGAMILRWVVASVEHAGRRIAWADLLRRVFALELLVCACGGARRVISSIEEGPVARKILQHLGLPSAVPAAAPARIDQGRQQPLAVSVWQTGPPALLDRAAPAVDEFDQRDHLDAA
jgi:putative transposase